MLRKISDNRRQAFGGRIFVRKSCRCLQVVFSILLVLALVTLGGAATAAPADKSLDFTIVNYGKLLKGPAVKRCWLVQKPAEWQWIANEYRQGGALPLPVGTDFRRHTLIVIDYGLATTAVHLSIDNVIREKGTLLVDAAIRTPAAGVSADGTTHRLLQVARCAKSLGTLTVQVKNQEYDAQGFIREKSALPLEHPATLRGLEPGKAAEHPAGRLP